MHVHTMSLSVCTAHGTSYTHTIITYADMLIHHHGWQSCCHLIKTQSFDARVCVCVLSSVLVSDQRQTCSHHLETPS